MRIGARWFSASGAWRVLPALMLGTAIGVPAAFADLGGFTIARFHTELRIEPGSGLIVEETLDVDFSEARHGIYRLVPVRYTDPTGYGWSLRFQLLGVGDGSGGRHTARVSSSGRYMEIRIGDADRVVRGRVTYVIRYRVGGALRSFPDHDELYWNATGHEWRTTIGAATATVHLPAALPADSLEAIAYVGAHGSRDTDVTIEASKPGVLEYDAGRALRPHEGLTVVASWPRGHVRFPGPAARAGAFVADNWIALAPLAAFAFLWRRYRRGGRDPGGAETIMVRYQPPNGMTPGGMGAIVDERVDLRDITATLVDLAIRGYVTIRSEPRPRLLGLSQRDETVFERRRDAPPAALQEHEQKLLDGLFEDGDRVEMSDLREQFYRRIPGITKALYERLARDGYFVSNPERVRRRWLLLGLGAGVVTVVAGLVWVAMRGGVMPNGLLLPLVSGVLVLGLFGAFSGAMPRRTSAGVRMRGWARGFEEFVDRVERDRLERDEARGVFERFLPYAMALGLSAKWARRFEGIYAERAPAWYVGTQAGHVSTRAFESSLRSTMSSAARTFTSSPRSSGSGGGGFSGGGGGGGGGGSW
jgi:uncharacterized membrane protein